MSQPGGGRMVYSEEITIAGPVSAEGALRRAGAGASGRRRADRHLLAGSRRARVAAGARAAADDGPPGVRHHRLPAPQQLFDVERLATAAQPLPVADLGWLRLGALRAMFAGLFDPPVGGAPLVQAARVTIRHRAGSDASALLLLAWLGVLLGWRPLRSAQTSDGGLRFDFVRAGQAVAGYLAPADGACGRSGMFGIELTTDGATATRSGGRRWTRPMLHTPGVPAQR